MPIHDWTRVDAGIFHDFHHGWIEEIKRALNRGLLPPDYYALAEQITGNLGPDVVTLRLPGDGPDEPATPRGGLAVAEVPPRVRFHLTSESDVYAAKANAVVIRHTSGHQVIAIVEIVSPGNKTSRRALDAFVRKADDAMATGIHLLIVDLFPPGPRNPRGIHDAIWNDRGEAFGLPDDKPLTCAAYLSAPMPEAFVEPLAVGDALPEMPVFISRDLYVPLPLEPTYGAAWEGVPPFWRTALTKEGNLHLD